MIDDIYVLSSEYLLQVSPHNGPEQLMSHSLLRRQPQLALDVSRARRLTHRAGELVQRLGNLVQGEPLRVRQLGVVVETDLLVAGQGLGDGTDHQAGRVRPRLGAVDDDAADPDARLLVDLPAGGLLHGLARLAEPGQRAVPVRLPAGVVAEQGALAVAGDDGHDDGRVGAAEGDVGDGVSGGARRPLDDGLACV